MSRGQVAHSKAERAAAIRAPRGDSMPCAPAPAAAFAAEHDAYRPALGTPQGFLTLLRDLPPRVGVNRKLREYVVRADNDSLERVGLYLSKG